MRKFKQKFYQLDERLDERDNRIAMLNLKVQNIQTDMEDFLVNRMKELHDAAIQRLTTSAEELRETQEARFKIMTDRILQFKSDIQIQVAKIEDIVGVNNPHLSSKVTMYSLNQVLKLILTYLVSNNFGNSTDIDHLMTEF